MIKHFIQDEDGFTGAEKALITVIGLGLILVVGRLIQQSIRNSASNAASALDSTQVGRGVNLR